MAIEQPGPVTGKVVSPGSFNINQLRRGIGKTNPYRREFPPVRIYNVGQWAPDMVQGHARIQGVGGTWLIPLRKDGEEYSAPLEIPDPFVQYSPKGLGTSMEECSEPGITVAQDLIGQTSGEELTPGVNANKSQDNDMRQWGIFIAKGEVPTAEELEAATLLYRRTLTRLVEDARKFHSMSETKFIGPRHHFAANKLGIKDKWNETAGDSIKAETIACPMCAEDIKAAAKKCRHCGHLLEETEVTGKGRKKA